MREQVFLLFVITFLRSASGNIAKKNCDDCILATSCQAAATLMHKKDIAAQRQLREAFCGFDLNYLPKVRCSMLSNAELTSPAPGVDSIEGHPNLQLLPESCGAISRSKLLGGLMTELNEYPWMVLIAYKTREGLQFKCSGSLINERYVLTAAHCISNQIAGVRIGEYNLETNYYCQGTEPYSKCEAPVQDLRIEEAKAHPDYRRESSFNNDIGIIRLKKPVNLTFENAKTICLPVAKDLQNRNLSGSYATIAGWGVSETGSTSSTLLADYIQILTQDHCSAELNRRADDSVEFTDKLCAGADDRIVRIGDDGGPLIVAGPHGGINRFIQYGIYSFGYPTRGSNTPTLYTDVSKYMKWILDTIKP